jgi:molecular chaperone GrpE
MPKSKTTKIESKETKQESHAVDEYLHFTYLQKGDVKVPTKKQLEKFQVPKTDLEVDGNILKISTQLDNISSSDISLSLTQDSLVILGKNKSVAYYTEIKLSEKVIPQSAVAKLNNGRLLVTIQKQTTEPPAWTDLERLDELRNDLNNSKDRLGQVQRQYHNIQQEYQNLLVKSKKEIETRVDNYKISMIERLLKNIDNFELAMRSTEKVKNEQNEQILVGINLILNDLKNIIKEECVSEVPGEGGLLDPMQHEVLDYEETDKYPENTILKVYQKGYKYKNCVLRPAKVRVAVPPKPKSKTKK